MCNLINTYATTDLVEHSALSSISVRNFGACLHHYKSVAYPGILFGGRGGSTNSVEDRGQRERGSGGGSPLVRVSGGSCNLVQEI